jgi:hypothetical protein
MNPTDTRRKRIEDAGGKWSVFLKWMAGQTVGMKNGEVDYYNYDIERFIRYSCNPDNEPVEDFD